MALHQLVTHLSSAELEPLIRRLQKHIGSKSGPGPCVYFAASHHCLRKIFDSGYLLPRNATKDLDTGPELSATGVQARRREVWLGNGKPIPPKRPVHDCLNFFFNPDNTTIDAFARNQMIQGGSPIELGILEFPIQKIAAHVENVGGLWACSDKNIANGGETSAKQERLEGSWPWDRILDTTEEHRYHKARSAEFLLWLPGGEKGCSTGLPVALASRILESRLCPLDYQTGLPSSGFLSLRTDLDLLKSETQLEKFLRNSPLSASGTFVNFANAARCMPFPLKSTDFVCEDLSPSDIHGLPHVKQKASL